MKIKPQSAPVRENEVVLKDQAGWLHFGDPHCIIRADSFHDVLPALRDMERRVEADRCFAAGFVAYEAAPAFDPAFPTFPAAEGLPYLWFGLYPEPRRIRLPRPQRPKELLAWQPTVSAETYSGAIERIKEHIARGRTYQVNYTMRLETHFHGDPWELFLHLAQTQNNHAAFVHTGRYVICSASPELFFQLDGASITCRPMKGTTARGRTTAEDIGRSQWLRTSEKNRAENVMIVDMIRNDLGRIAELGSVEVRDLFHVERYPTLWQMTSTVTARTRAAVPEIFAALFPCASITGAPKVSTMQIISELETTPRRIYTGSIGYLAPGRKASFNVAIRTAFVDREQATAEYGVGGGIVWDSTGPDEYAEALLKARVLTERTPEFSLLETMLWMPGEGFFLRDKHVERLLDSAAYFDFPISRADLEGSLEQIAGQFTSSQRVRLLLHRNGQLDSEATPVGTEDKSGPLNACLAREPVDSREVFLFHKTTNRTIYEAARAGFEGFDDVLLYNESGELTEFTIGNLVLELGGQCVTPPISSGVLPGTFRAFLLETGQVVERVVRAEHLKDCGRIFRINSVRKWQEVNLQLEPDKIV
jgi:para-aminobenzoate synthetase / 4-amino-4-deoxychorismate lyase